MQATRDKAQEESENTQATDQEMDEEECPFKAIDELQNHGVNGGDINKLKAHGLCTIVSCLMM